MESENEAEWMLGLIEETVADCGQVSVKELKDTKTMHSLPFRQHLTELRSAVSYLAKEKLKIKIIELANRYKVDRSTVGDWIRNVRKNPEWRERVEVGIRRRMIWI